MKLYRVNPISLFSIYSEVQTKKLYTEEIYFNGGYITKSSIQANKWSGNDIAPRIKNDGKYFYFFPEHAIQIGCNMYPGETILKLMEYNLPDEVAFKLVGTGLYYNAGYQTITCPETFVTYQDIGTTIINSSSLSKEEKLTLLKASAREVYNRINSGHDFIGVDDKSFEEIYKKLRKEDQDLIFGAHLIKKYLKTQNFDLIKNPLVTSNCWTFNTNFKKEGISSKLFEKNTKYFAEHDLPLFLNEEAIHDRELFSAEIYSGNVDKARSLINTYHHDYPNH